MWVWSLEDVNSIVIGVKEFEVLYVGHISKKFVERDKNANTQVTLTFNRLREMMCL